MLMGYPLPSRAKELLAVNKLRLRVVNRSHKPEGSLGHTERQECQLCGYDKEDSLHILCDCPVLACKRYRIWGSMFLSLKILTA
jgi:predicted Zn-ribbon and HTH transcriptional regulator